MQGWELGTADTQGQLRAERSLSGSGRTYTLTYQASDHAGNVANCITTVEVPAPFAGTMADAATLQELVEAADYDPATHGSVLRLYWAFFNREPDIGGAQYWIDINSQGYTLDQIAEYFTASQEFANNYAGTSNQQYLEAVYSNVLGRYYDQAGFHYWLGLLETGQLNRGGVVRWIAANNEFIDKHPYLPY